MLTMGEWCNTVSNMLHHVWQGLSGDWAREAWERSLVAEWMTVQSEVE